MVENMMFFMLLGVIPFILVAGTSFAKISVVLTIVKNAFGSGGIPPVSVLTSISVIMTFFIMAPVVQEMVENIKESTLLQSSDLKNIQDNKNSIETDIVKATAVYNIASPPLKTFLKSNTPKAELEYYGKLAHVSKDGYDNIRILLMAFASSQLVSALLTGILVLIPFILVDLITGVTLTAMGLTGISVMTISLPLKLLVFIAADGWHLLINALITSYS